MGHQKCRCLSKIYLYKPNLTALWNYAGILSWLVSLLRLLALYVAWGVGCMSMRMDFFLHIFWHSWGRKNKAHVHTDIIKWERHYRDFLTTSMCLWKAYYVPYGSCLKRVCFQVGEAKVIIKYWKKTSQLQMVRKKNQYRVLEKYSPQLCKLTGL